VYRHRRYTKSRTHEIAVPNEVFISQLADALYFSMIICYAQGMALLYKASTDLKMDIRCPKWFASGVAVVLYALRCSKYFIKHSRRIQKLPNLLLDKNIAALLQARKHNMVAVIIHATQTGFPVSALMTSLCYLEAYRSEFLQPTSFRHKEIISVHTHISVWTCPKFPYGMGIVRQLKLIWKIIKDLPQPSYLFFGGSGDLNLEN